MSRARSSSPWTPQLSRRDLMKLSAAGVVGHVEEDLRLGVREVQLGRPLPEELAERGAPQGVQQVEEPLGLGGSGGRRA